MHEILVLRATPRSTSTSFEWMMRLRGDMACFHEPFGEAWYDGDDAQRPLCVDSVRYCSEWETFTVPGSLS